MRMLEILPEPGPARKLPLSAMEGPIAARDAAGGCCETDRRQRAPKTSIA
jgi:hypothetical protein